jgi:hypothetical protein
MATGLVAGASDRVVFKCVLGEKFGQHFVELQQSAFRPFLTEIRSKYFIFLE